MHLFFFTYRYTPVQLPRADIKPYHESYFSDNPSTSIGQLRTTTTTTSNVQSNQSTPSNGDIVPLEGLAATLHARMINNQSSNNSTIKNESSSRDRRYLNNKVFYCLDNFFQRSLINLYIYIYYFVVDTIHTDTTEVVTI